MRGATVGVTLAMVFVARSASADAAACVQTEDLGNRARDAGRLMDARAHFRWCSATACPTEIRDACAQAMLDVEQRIPSIVVEARDDEHRVVKDAHVVVDGLEISAVSDDCELMIDPGDRVVRIERSGYLPVTMRLNVAEGAHGIPIRVALMRPRYDEPGRPPMNDPPRARSSSHPIWALPLALAGASVFTAGLVSGYRSMGEYDDASRAQLQIATGLMLPIGAAAMLFGLYKATTPSRREPQAASIVNGTF